MVKKIYSAQCIKDKIHSILTARGVAENEIIFDGDLHCVALVLPSNSEKAYCFITIGNGRLYMADQHRRRIGGIFNFEHLSKALQTIVFRNQRI